MIALLSRPRDAAKGGVWLAGCVIVIAIVATWANSLAGVFVLDDLHTIVHNRALERPLSVDAIFAAPRGSPAAGRPLVAASLAFNYALGGTTPAGYHIINIAIHALTALLLLGFVRRTLAADGMPGAVSRAALPLAATTTAWWALHPIHTACVTYISQRAETLFGLMALATLYASRRYFEAGASRAWAVVAVAACTLGMAAKETMAVVPLLVLLYDRAYVAPVAAPLRARRRFYLALFAPLTLLILLNLSAPRGASVTLSQGGLNPWTYLLSQADALTGYLASACWPLALVFDYGTDHATALAEVWPAALLVVALLLGVMVGLRYAPRAAWPGAAFFVLLAPSSSVVPIASEIAADHRMYLPLAALVALVVSGTWYCLRRLPCDQDARWPAAVALAAVVVVAATLATLTHARNRVFLSAVSLWGDVVDKRPGNHRAWIYLGNARLAAGETNAAVGAYRHALSLRPANNEALANLALARMAQGRLDEAIAHARQALAGAGDDTPRASRFAMRHNLGIALARSGRADEALGWFDEALAIDAQHRDAMMNRGKALLDLGARQAAARRAQLFEQAAVQFAHVTASYPNDAEAHAKLATAHFSMLAVPQDGTLDANTRRTLAVVVEHFERAVSLAAGSPEQAEYAANLARVRARLLR